MTRLNGIVTDKLKQAHPGIFALYAGVAAFSAYACMYGFRKPFTAAQYNGLSLWGVDFKIVLVCAQVTGYAISKFIGISYISGMRSTRRAATLLGLLGAAQIALLGFAVTPYPFNAFWMFVNGLPLGMIWGLVFGYLEGRRVTEFLAAALSVNFIISSGFVKSVGKCLLLEGFVPEFWMPFMAGMFFLPFLLISVWMLERLPPPDEADQRARNARPRMTGKERAKLWKKYMPGFVLLSVAYLMLTVIRDVRDNFAVEIWSALGYEGQPAILTTAELPVAAFALLGLGCLMFVRNNFKAFWLNQFVCLFGALLLSGSTAVFQSGLISPLSWMVLSGLGLFLPYIIFNGILFDRFLAAFKEQGNVGFLMYMADAVGYLGAVGVLVWRNFGFADLSWLRFYQNLCHIGAWLFIFIMLISAWFFRDKQLTNKGLKNKKRRKTRLQQLWKINLT